MGAWPCGRSCAAWRRRRDLAVILQAMDTIDVKVLLVAIQKTVEFEGAVAQRFAAIVEVRAAWPRGRGGGREARPTGPRGLGIVLTYVTATVSAAGPNAAPHGVLSGDQCRRT